MRQPLFLCFLALARPGVVYSSGRATIQPTLGIHQLATTHAARSWVGWDQTPPGGTYHPRPYILDNTGGMAGLSGQLCKQTCSFGINLNKKGLRENGMIPK